MAMTKNGKYWGEQAAGAIIFSMTMNKFLLGVRSPDVNEPGTLGTFGGAVENGDSIEETVDNELMEELGFYIPLVKRALPQYTDENFTYHNFVAITYEKPENITIELNWENSDIKWLSLNELLEYNKDELHFGLKKLLENSEAIKVLSLLEKGAKKNQKEEQYCLSQ